MAQFILPSNAGIGGVSLHVSDIDRSLKFYSELIGLNLFERDNGVASLSATGQSPSLIQLKELPGAIPKPAGTTGLYHTAILFPSRGELAKVLNRLVMKRYPLQGAADHGVSEAIYLADPDGLGVELYADKPREQWPRRGGELQMVSEPLDLEAILAEHTSTESRDSHPTTIIGHVHLHVAGLTTAEQFYSGVMGFTVTQRSYPGARFLAAGTYHHHVGINTWAGKTPPPSNAVGLGSFTIQITKSSFEAFIAQLGVNGVSYSEQEIGPGIRDAVVHDPDGITVRVAAI